MKNCLSPIISAYPVKLGRMGTFQVPSQPSTISFIKTQGRLSFLSWCLPPWRAFPNTGNLYDFNSSVVPKIFEDLALSPSLEWGWLLSTWWSFCCFGRGSIFFLDMYFFFLFYCFLFLDVISPEFAFFFSCIILWIHVDLMIPKDIKISSVWNAA